MTRDGTGRPLGFAVMVVVVISGFLALDHFATEPQQLMLGLATWAILLASVAPLGHEDRARALLVVCIATCAEIVGSIILGAYTYRLENLPAFVPPGHGLVYLGGLRISQSRVVREHRRAFLGLVIGFVAVWGAAGLIALGRTDGLGALAGAGLIYVLARGSRPTLYAGVFLIVGFLEIYGTSIGAWQWSAAAPGGLPAGNPPSGIASVYVLFDIAAIALAPPVLRALETLSATASPVKPTSSRISAGLPWVT